MAVRHVGDYVRAGDMGAIMGKQRERTGDKNQAITWQGKAITWKGKEIRWPGKAITWPCKAIRVLFTLFPNELTEW